jgi:asparagine synthase (glutamine-hydrolysing)
MSAIGGVYNFDGKPVGDEFLRRMGSLLAACGPDGGRELNLGAVAMVYRAFDTTRESRQEVQPLMSPNGHLLCWDGRLDNRSELIPSVGDRIFGEHTDAAIVLAAYQKWGNAFTSHLIGDFALSLWDLNSRALMLARDHVGVRHLFYRCNEQRIVWATDLNALLELTGDGLEINEEYVADFLTRHPQAGQTPYKHTYEVPPAHLVTVIKGRVKSARSWRLDPDHQIRYRTDAEYEEHFRHLFREAVKCRLRSDRPVWSELSGGFDSSSIVCMAHDIRLQGAAEAPAFETVSRVFDEAAGSDERKFITPVETKIGKKGLHLREDDYRLISPLGEKYSRLFPNPIADLAEYYRAVSEAMKEGGARVLLMGHGGDEVLNSSPDCTPELSELLLRVRPLQLHQRLKVWSKSLQKGYAETFWRKAVQPALPDWVQMRRNTRSLRIHASIYTDEFIRRLNFRERLLGPKNEFGFGYPVARVKAKYVAILTRTIASGKYQSLVDASVTFPFTHRPLIEFMMALPFDQCTRPGETRSLGHRAMRPLLPVEIAERQDKGLCVYAYLAALARESARLESLFRDARVCTFGYVKPAALRELVELAKTGKSQRSTLLMSLICLEHWLRAVESRVAPVSVPALDPLSVADYSAAVPTS